MTLLAGATLVLVGSHPTYVALFGRGSTDPVLWVPIAFTHGLADVTTVEVWGDPTPGGRLVLRAGDTDIRPLGKTREGAWHG
jgi:hypothetical protein